MNRAFNLVKRGAGGGGASASIYVTGLQESDSVTMITPSGGTVQGVWDEVERYEATEVPKMTSNSMDGFVASLQSNSSGSANNAYTAFNGSTIYASDYKAYLANSIGNYIQIQFPTPIVPTRFTGRFMLNHYSSWGAVPRTIVWELRASVDGVTFVSLDTITTIATTSGGLTYIDYSTDISSADAYAYYRIVITGGNATQSIYGGMGCAWQIYGLKQTTIQCFRLLASEYGMHTITATNGVKTSTEEVLVDALMDYWVEMDYYTYLYRYGSDGFNSSHKFTGWNAYTRVDSVNTLTGYAVTALSNQYSLIQSDTKISVQAGQKLCVELNTSAINKSGAESRLALSSVQDYAVANEVQVAGDLILSIGTQVQSMIVNSSGSYYVSIPIFSATTVITKIWLE